MTSCSASCRWAGDHTAPVSRKDSDAERRREDFSTTSEGKSVRLEPKRLRFRKCVPNLPSPEDPGNRPFPSGKFALSAFKEKLVPYDRNRVL